MTKFKTLLFAVVVIYNSLHIKLLTVFRDVKTPWPYLEDLTKFGADEQAAGSNKPNSIYMDAMGFGMGCCCLQMTFQVKLPRVPSNNITIRW